MTSIGRETCGEPAAKPATWLVVFFNSLNDLFSMKEVGNRDKLIYFCGTMLAKTIFNQFNYETEVYTNEAHIF